MSFCPLPKNSASAASTALVKASSWAWEEANSLLVALPDNGICGRFHLHGKRVNQELTAAGALLRARLALRLELTPVLDASVPVRVRIKSVGTPLMLICEIAEGLHDCKLNLSVGVVQIS